MQATSVLADSSLTVNDITSLKATGEPMLMNPISSEIIMVVKIASCLLEVNLSEVNRYVID